MLRKKAAPQDSNHQEGFERGNQIVPQNNGKSVEELTKIGGWIMGGELVLLMAICSLMVITGAVQI